MSGRVREGRRAGGEGRERKGKERKGRNRWLGWMDGGREGGGLHMLAWRDTALDQSSPVQARRRGLRRRLGD
jgi:hypothetical protein